MTDSTTATTTKADTVETGTEPVTTESGTTQANAATESGTAGTEPGTGTGTATGGTGKDATGTNATGTDTDTSTSTPSVTIDLRPASTSVKRQLLRLGLTYNSRQGDSEIWYQAVKNLQATIPDKDSTSCTLFDATSGETRTVTASELEGVDRILTAQDGLEAA